MYEGETGLMPCCTSNVKYEGETGLMSCCTSNVWVRDWIDAMLH